LKRLEKQASSNPYDYLSQFIGRKVVVVMGKPPHDEGTVGLFEAIDSVNNQIMIIQDRSQEPVFFTIGAWSKLKVKSECE